MIQVINLSNDIDSTVANRFKQDLASQAVEHHAPLLCAMEYILYGSIWLPADDPRRGDVSFSDKPLERVEQVWSTGMRFLHDAET